MTLQQWIKNMGGASCTARLLKTKSHRVANWINRKAVPRPEMILKIVTFSKNKLDCETIIRSTLKKRKVQK